jgi:Gas vesicle synthesis protein GvpO
MAETTNNKKKKANLAEIARSARRQVAELTGRPPEAVLGVERDDGGWKVEVETLELERVPNSTDLLACYILKIDDDGDVVEYRRGRKYMRGQADEDA